MAGGGGAVVNDSGGMSLKYANEGRLQTRVQRVKCSCEISLK
jgi:hypothetical protein